MSMTEAERIVDSIRRNHNRSHATWNGAKSDRFKARKARVRKALVPASEIPLHDTEVEITLGNATEESYVVAQTEALMERDFRIPDDNFDPMHASELTPLPPVNKLAANTRYYGGVTEDYFLATYEDANGQIHKCVKPGMREAYDAWKATQVKDYAATRKQANGRDCFNIGVTSEELVLVQENDSGKLIRYWLDKTECNCYECRTLDPGDKPETEYRNASAKVTYDPRKICWIVQVYTNRKNAHTNRWSGTKVAEYTVSRTVTEESELTVSKYIALEFAKAQASH